MDFLLLFGMVAGTVTMVAVGIGLISWCLDNDHEILGAALAVFFISLTITTVIWGVSHSRVQAQMEDAKEE